MRKCEWIYCLQTLNSSHLLRRGICQCTSFVHQSHYQSIQSIIIVSKGKLILIFILIFIYDWREFPLDWYEWSEQNETKLIFITILSKFERAKKHCLKLRNWHSFVWINIKRTKLKLASFGPFIHVQWRLGFCMANIYTTFMNLSLL